MEDDSKIVPYGGLFRVIIPECLNKISIGNITKLMNAVDKFDVLMKNYGKDYCSVEKGFYNWSDDLGLYYTELLYIFSDSENPEIVVKIESECKELYNSLIQGMVSGDFKIYLKGTVIFNKDGIDNIDKSIQSVEIKGVEARWTCRRHSRSISLDEINEAMEAEDKLTRDIMSEKVVPFDKYPSIGYIPVSLNDDDFNIQVDNDDDIPF